eukprot:TRINITY_DN15874_c0_g1_i1.p2 TRINITY_DN15874_c0_g1~~TRINITY_DN15874_c0_g1_i1.p2  ORF type:complete len:127 (-),score=20.20 TRINITY_DN15874_c0_g1_i1:31-411(-)
MIQIESKIKVVDNSGANKIKCLKILNKSNKSRGKVGDIIVGVVCRLRKSQKFKKVKRKEIVYGLLVSTKDKISRNGGNILINFESTNVVLLNKSKSLLANRVKGSVFKELNIKGYNRVTSLSKNII